MKPRAIRGASSLFTDIGKHYMEESYFDRSELLLGPEVMRRLATARVILFGTGGVGSWCAEGLIRTGLRHLTIVDSDTVAPSNVNRQLPATSSTIGQAKTEVLRRRLLDINPDACVTARCERFNAQTVHTFALEEFDYVIDAIDSVADKALLILRATSARGVILLSSMGAARKIDPQQVRVAEFWQVKGCPLAAALRSRFKRTGEFPARKFKAVFSPEIRRNTREGAGANGSLVHITAVWGMTLVSLLIRHLADTTVHPSAK